MVVSGGYVHVCPRPSTFTLTPGTDTASPAALPNLLLLAPHQEHQPPGLSTLNYTLPVEESHHPMRSARDLVDREGLRFHHTLLACTVLARPVT